MADRIMTWHVPADAPYPVSLPRYYADADYEKVALRVYAETAPASDLRADIQAGGVSIFANPPKQTFSTQGMRTTTPTTTVVLTASENEETDIAEEFNDSLIEEGTWVTCSIPDLLGAKGLTIQLELARVGDEGL